MVKSNEVAIGPAGSRAVGPALDAHTFPVYLYLNDVDIGPAGSTYFRYRYRKRARI